MNHGTLAGYKRHGCRCQDCKDANAAYSRTYNQRHPEQRARIRWTTCPECGGRMSKGNGNGRDAKLCLACTVAAYPEPAHGTLSRYQSPRFRCRCDACKQANTDRQRAYLEQRRRNEGVLKRRYAA